MAEVTPFRAVRYTGAAGRWRTSSRLRTTPSTTRSARELYTRSPYNVVHVTLPESAEAAGRLYRDWLADGILARDDDEATWLAAERYVGPDGVERERHGVIGSVAAEPYATGGVLPHERTHARIRDERLELLRATACSPSRSCCSPPGRSTSRSRSARPTRSRRDAALARVGSDAGSTSEAPDRRRPPSLRERRRARRELGAPGARIMALVVSVDDPGSARLPDAPRLLAPARSLGARARGAVRAISTRRSPRSRASRATLCGGRLSPRAGRARPRLEGELDVALVDRLRSRRHRATRRVREAAAAASTAAMRTSRSSCGRRASTTSSRSRAAASGCRRRARTSPRSRSRASSSTRSSR